MTALQLAQRAVAVHQAEQEPAELAALLALFSTRAGYQDVLEIGTGLGGTAWAFAQLPSVRQVVTISLPGSVGYSEPGMLNGRVHVILGDSGSPATRALAKSWGPPEGYDLVLIDGDHTYEAAVRDWMMYGPLCVPGGLVALHDTRDYPGRDDHQVSRLWAEIRAEHVSVELVSNPGGPCGTGVIFWRP